MTAWQFILETAHGIVAAGLLALGLRCLVIAWMLVTYKPTPEDEERWARKRRDRMFADWVRGNYPKKL